MPRARTIGVLTLWSSADFFVLHSRLETRRGGAASGQHCHAQVNP